MDFLEKNKKLIRSDGSLDFLGIKKLAQYELSKGISSLTSSIGFLEDVDDEQISDIPDYVVSENIEKDFDSIVVTCILLFQKYKYLPNTAKINTTYGAVPKGQNEGVSIDNWEDYSIKNYYNQPLYTVRDVESFTDVNGNALGGIMNMIVRDICDDGKILSEEWYLARIITEYFEEYPVRISNSFLIGMLWKELCIKDQIEDSLEDYFLRLKREKESRKKGALKSKEKAEELRSHCVSIAVNLALDRGAKFMMAPPSLQAKTIREIAIRDRCDDFMRGGKKYSENWFLKNIVEDMKLDIIEAIEQIQTSKKA